MKRSSVVTLTSLAVLMMASTVGAQPACGSSGGQLGPCPALIDTNGNGRPDPGIDQEINFSLVGDQLTVLSPWTSGPCADGNVIDLTGQDGPYTGASRPRPGGNIQQMYIEGYDGNGDPRSFGFYESASSTSGRGLLQDANGDLRYESLRLEAPLNLDLGFVGADLDGDNEADYISVPWAQSSLFGMNGSCALPGVDPQIWLPLDGDRIVVGYAGFLPSPRLVTSLVAQQQPGIPELSRWGLPVLAACLAIVGWWLIRRQQLLG